MNIGDCPVSGSENVSGPFFFIQALGLLDNRGKMLQPRLLMMRRQVQAGCAIDSIMRPNNGAGYIS